MLKYVYIFIAFSFFNLLNAKELRIGLWTSWGISCGIANYSKHLYDAIRKYRYFIVAYPNNKELTAIKKSIKNDRINLLYIQYIPPLFPNTKKFIQFLQNLKRETKIKIVLTVHHDNQELLEISKVADVLIYFQKPQVNINSKKVMLMPMGIPVYEPKMAKSDLKVKYGFDTNDIIISSIGFPFPNKEVDKILKYLLPRLKVDKRIKLQLITPNSSIVGDLTKDENRKIDDLIESIGVKHQVLHITKFIPEEELNDRLHMSDISYHWVSSDYKNETSSSAKQYISARVPLVIPNASHFADIKSGCIKTAHVPEIFIDTIFDTLNNKDLLSNLIADQTSLYNQLNFHKIINLQLLEFKKIINKE